MSEEECAMEGGKETCSESGKPGRGSAGAVEEPRCGDTLAPTGTQGLPRTLWSKCPWSGHLLSLPV